MWNSLKTWIFPKKKVEEKVEERKKEENCRHNWITVEVSEEYFRYSDRYTLKYTKVPHLVCHAFMMYSRAKNLVCTRCGECYPGIQIAKDWIKNEKKQEKELKKKKRREKILAKQLWEDGCKQIKKGETK